jgi:hypothetical protein
MRGNRYLDPAWLQVYFPAIVAGLTLRPTLA